MARTATISSSSAANGAQLMPEAAFVSPHAPERAPGAPMGRQWFALSNRSPDDTAGGGERWTGAVKARGAIDAFLDAELQRLGLDDSKLALVGFSQGCMMALHVGLRRPRAPAAILGFSGLLVGPEHLGEATARDAHGRPPPILLIHGDQDPMIPFDAMFMAAEALAGASIPTQWHLSARDRPRDRRRGPAPGRPFPRQGVLGPKALAAAPAHRFRPRDEHCSVLRASLLFQRLKTYFLQLGNSQGGGSGLDGFCDGFGLGGEGLKAFAMALGWAVRV